MQRSGVAVCGGRKGAGEYMLCAIVAAVLLTAQLLTARRAGCALRRAAGGKQEAVGRRSIIHWDVRVSPRCGHCG